MARTVHPERAKRVEGPALLLAALALLSSCVGPTDNASQVRDLRVLAVQFDPPELMAPACSSEALAQIAFVRPVKMKTLIADPKGEGREIAYTITACANVNDRTCDNENDFVELAAGTTQPGVMEHTFVLAANLLPDNVPLLAEVVSQDTYRGLGGVRLPVVVKLSAGEEVIYAQKLMVFSCRFFAGQKANVNPVLPGVLLDGQEWPDGSVRTLSGTAPFVLEPMEFADREEDYIVPSFGLEPVALREAWKIAWHATLGGFSSTETGGIDFAGEAERHRNEWSPGTSGVVSDEQDVTFTFVVRDGRGGISWLTRTARWVP